jgi:tRNA(fMet)-specific endonuclease VapC
MATLIDASVLIEAERGRLDLTDLLSATADDPAAIAAVTASELLHGVHRAAPPRFRSRREAFVEHLLSKLPVIPFDLLAARVHARIWADLSARGIVIGPHDLLIGATAIAIGASVATRDLRSFPKIPHLNVTRW